MFMKKNQKETRNEKKSILFQYNSFRGPDKIYTFPADYD